MIGNTIKRIALFTLLWYSISVNAIYTPIVDSLKKEIKKSTSLQHKIDVYNQISLHLLKNANQSLSYSDSALQLAQQINYEFGKAESYYNKSRVYKAIGKTDSSIVLMHISKQYCLNTKALNNHEIKNKNILYSKISLFQGILIHSKGDNMTAMNVFLETIKFTKTVGANHQLAVAHLRLGWVYYELGNKNEAIKQFYNGLEVAEKEKDDNTMGYAYNNIATLYADQKNNDKALYYYNKAIPIAIKDNDLRLSAIYNNNISKIYLNKKSIDSALIYAEKSFELGKKGNDLQCQINALISQSNILAEKKEMTLSLEKGMEALNLSKLSNTKAEIVSALSCVANGYELQKDYSKAIFYYLLGYNETKKMSVIQTRYIAMKLHKNYALQKDYKQAYQYQTIYTMYNDSVLNQDNKKELILQEYKKQSLADSLKYVTDKRITEFHNQSTVNTIKKQLFVVISVLIGFIVLGVVLYNRFKITQKQNRIIEAQSKEIQDSINYSKDIQTIFLKPIDINSRFLDKVILIYKPKDVVSGDFYWNREIGENLFVVVGDCTGHGIPGAIISTLAIQSLEKLIDTIINVNELHLLNQLLREEFNRYYHADSGVSIGLDYSMVCINKKERKIYATGSSSPIIIKEKNKVVLERFDSINIGGKMPVVYHPKTVVYHADVVDTIYLYTDGIVDQKGNDDKKKFGTKRLIHLIENMETKNASLALSKIENSISSWMQTEQQVDDITILGLQINA